MAKAKKSNFLSDVWYELTTKVVWPTWSRLRIATTVVVGFIILWALLLAFFDYSFTAFVNYIVEGEKVQKQYEEIMKRNAPATEGEDGLPEGIEFPPIGEETPAPVETDQ